VREVVVLGGDSDEYEKRLAAAEPVTRPHDHRPGGDPRRPARRHRENVYPAEVERVLMQHPDVAEVAVIGAALIAFTRDRLAHYKCPTSVSVVPALPRNPTGKVLKRQLRSSFIPDHGPARAAVPGREESGELR
jgi:hypothetical protein